MSVLEREGSRLGPGLGRRSSSEERDGAAAKPLVEFFGELDPEQFREEIATLWAGAQEIVEKVVDVVEQGKLPPITGVAAISCVLGQTFAYQSFHGQQPPAEMYAALAAMVRP